MAAPRPPLPATPRGAYMGPTAWALLNDYQHGFPLCSRPFGAIGAQVGCDEVAVVLQYRQWQRQGRIGRIGPVFAPLRAGVSTLAAMRVPPARLAEVAALVSGFDEVNHNYEREHDFNLWFVAAAAQPQGLQSVLEAIAQRSALEVLALPLVEQYHIDLGFCLARGTNHSARSAARSPVGIAQTTDRPTALDDDDQRLIAATQNGLPLCEQPYAALAHTLGWSEAQVLARLQAWLERGVLKRWGVVVRHHEAGFTANAMLVHDVPDEAVSALGQRLGQHPAVTLCYRRPRAGTQWPYNLFCMVHGRERAQVQEQITQLRQDMGLGAFPHAVLFSRQRFKQTGARYALAP